MQRMKRLSLLAAAVAMLLVTVAAAPVGASSEASHTRSDVMWFADPGAPVGTSNLIRTDSGVVGTFRTSGLMPQETLTLWWVVFNNPAGCTEPCGEDDIFTNGDPAQGLNEAGIANADIVVGYAAGTVANRHGGASMAGWLRENGSVREVLFGDDPVLKDSREAEIHLVARSHGPAVPGQVGEQIGSYAGGCDFFLNPPAIPAAVGECADIQFAVHLP